MRLLFWRRDEINVGARRTLAERENRNNFSIWLGGLRRRRGLSKSDLVCTLAVYSRTFREYPLVIAANRDEFFDRESLDPDLIPSAPAIYCGRDGIHGGTWLGVNAAGVAAALLNRRTLAPPNPSLRSRGLLCLEALAHPTAASAAGALAGLPHDSYNPFNLLVADAEELWVF